MAVTLKRKDGLTVVIGGPATAVTPPGEDHPTTPPKQMLLQALAEFSSGKRGKKAKLYIVNNKTKTEFLVKHWNPEERRAELVGTNHKHLHPIVGAREEPHYTPIWR